MNASMHFDLYLDAVLQPSTVDVDNTPTFKLKRYLTNYPAGLPAGVHTFVGDFYVNGTLLLTTGTVSVSLRKSVARALRGGGRRAAPTTAPITAPAGLAS
jgi:hypothetical protein